MSVKSRESFRTGDDSSESIFDLEDHSWLNCWLYFSIWTSEKQDESCWPHLSSLDNWMLNCSHLKGAFRIECCWNISMFICLADQVYFTDTMTDRYGAWVKLVKEIEVPRVGFPVTNWTNLLLAGSFYQSGIVVSWQNAGQLCLRSCIFKLLWTIGFESILQPNVFYSKSDKKDA